MKLVVIEGPGKIEALKKYLGSGYDVFATKGHIRDLPVNEFAIDLNNDFKPKYLPMPDKTDIIKDLQKRAKSASEILLATDPDREGEAISWHIANVLGINDNSCCRVEFNEISKDVVQKAVENPRRIDMNLVDAQQARRVLDRIVGYKISPIICRKIKPHLSAGRVQSVALEIVVDRENEIINFVPKEYWNVAAFMQTSKKEVFKTNLEKFEGKKIKLENEEQTKIVLADIQGKTGVVTKVKRDKTLSKPNPPFTTSTMQQDAQNKLGYDLSKTSKVAQLLYEGVMVAGEGKVALITYIRTDSTRVSEDAQKKAKEYIKSNFGNDYCPSKYRVYEAKASAQDAHEAIRPINLERTPESLKDKISVDAYKLYKLIFDRFLASQMSDAILDNLNVLINVSKCEFKATGKTVSFPGYMAAYKTFEEKSEDDEPSKMPNLNVDEMVELKDVKPEQKFTKPPQRFTEASLVKIMEEKGIGRPATYAPTIVTLQSRAYTEKQGKYLVPTELGMVVTDYMKQNFKSIMDIEFTAQMEESLDKIAEGDKIWQEVISKFWKHFQPILRNADSTHYDKAKSEAEVTDIKCELCGKPMVIREGRYGKFLGCSGYPSCKNIKNMNDNFVVEKNESKDFGICPKCGKKIIEKHTKNKKIFYGCEGYPECDYASWTKPKVKKGNS